MTPKAIHVIYDRIHESPAYVEARSQAVQEAAKTCAGCICTDDFRNLGGRSAIIKRAVDRAISTTNGVNDNLGSKLYPLSPADVLRNEPLYNDVVTEEFKLREQNGEK